eukprot:TRINITY_DN2072_c0_g1_i1.p1 TRINITY_DN2072_c0_g1~~TRINITY_DN2072_c0_g1_i1.p1  ORF type:complete len:591 (+),score=226.60 TRINITY_DN2072_c0_g1_i1:392-2164(+)
MMSGNANEFLWSIDYSPTEFPDNFVNDMVHHTLQDANGYVEDLTFEKVEQYVAFIKNYLQEENKILENGPKLKQFVKESLQELQEDVDKLTSLEVFETDKIPTEKSAALKKLLQELQDVKEEVLSLVSFDREEKEAKLKQEEKEREDQERLKAEQEREQKTKEEKERLEKEEQEKRAKEEQKQETEVKEKTPQKEKKGSVDDLTASQGLNKIKIVANDVDRIGSEFKVLKDNTEQLKFEELIANPRAASLLEDFKKKCTIYSATLMNDLLALDQVVGSQSTRKARKDQVNTIQAMLDEIDLVNNKLHDLAQQLHQQKEEKEKSEHSILQPKAQTKPQVAEADTESFPQEQSTLQKQHHQQHHQQPQHTADSEVTGQLAPRAYHLGELRKKDRKTTILQDKWKQMKLKPKVDIQETKEAYILVSYIPGLKSEEIQISFSKVDQTLTIEGVRVPSIQEENAMKEKLKQLLQEQYGTTDIPEEDLETLLLKFAMGRFGRFSETYRVPKNADLESISADYQRGMLQVVIPKTFSPPPQIRQARPLGKASPYFGSNQFAPHLFYPPRATHAPHSNPNPYLNTTQPDFFDDRDYWW